MASELLTAVTLTLCLALRIMGQSLILVQSPEFKPAREGQTVELWCGVENSKVSDIDLKWEYLDVKDPAKTLMFDGYTSDDRFKSTRNVSRNSFNLIIANVKLVDSGFYYCFVHDTNSRGTGTELIVVGSQSPSIVQSPKLVNVGEGGTAQLQCTMDKVDMSQTDVHWYRQHLRQRREWILTYRLNDQIIVPTAMVPLQGSTQHLQPSRVTSNKTYILILIDVSVSDTAVYHCCVWSTVCGDGTQLNVTEQSLRDVQTPYIAVIVVVCCLALVFLCITVVFYMKQMLCFKKKSRGNGSLSGQPCNSLRAPDGNAVCAEVNDQTQSLPQASLHPPISTNNKAGVDEIQYSHVYFKKATRSPSLTATDSATEYAVIQRKK